MAAFVSIHTSLRAEIIMKGLKYSIYKYVLIEGNSVKVDYIQNYGAEYFDV